MKYELTSDELYVGNEKYCSIKAAEKAFYKIHKGLTLKEWNQLAQKHNWPTLLVKIIKE